MPLIYMCDVVQIVTSLEEVLKQHLHHTTNTSMLFIQFFLDYFKIIAYYLSEKELQSTFFNRS
jgi:hypothetical protein